MGNSRLVNIITQIMKIVVSVMFQCRYDEIYPSPVLFFEHHLDAMANLVLKVSVDEFCCEVWKTAFLVRIAFSSCFL